MKKAFVDLDGTLINSFKRHVIVLKYALMENGINNLVIDDYIECKRDGYSTKRYLVEKKNVPSNIAESVCLWWTLHIEDHVYMQYDTWYEDVDEFIDFLNNEGYQIIVLTARKSVDFTKKLIKKSNINRYIYSLEIVNPSLAKDEKFKITKDSESPNNIMIGDTEVDYYAAKKNNISCFLLNRGFRNINYWRSLDVTSFGSLSEVKKEILNIKMQ